MRLKVWRTQVDSVAVPRLICTLISLCVCVVPCTSDTYELHWRAENNKCYFVSKKKENYDTARSNCQKYDYDLVSFTDEQEKDFVLSKSKYEFIQIISFCH